MRKTQVALAAMALVASTAVLADGVTIYGSMDAGVASASGSATHFADGNWNGGSHFGLKGSEDIGGLKAGYTLETGFNMTNGTMGNGGTIPSSLSSTATQGVFNRQANVSLSGDFGSITIGQQLNQYIAGAAGSTLGGIAHGAFFVNTLITGAAGGSAGGFFSPNAITYALPSMNGLNVAVQTQMKGTSTTVGDSMTSASASYAAGAVNLSAGYIDRTGVEKAYVIGGTTNLAGANVNLRYTSHETTAGVSTSQYVIGAAYPLSEALTASVNYANNSGANKKQLLNFGLQYALSKRTVAYALMNNGSNASGLLYSSTATAPAAGAGSKSAFAVGIVHNF